MKCEKCEQELRGSTVICRQCGFNNALQRLGGWRARQDGTLIPFPVSPHKTKSSDRAKESDPEARPPWRNRLDEKIREIRERRDAESHERQTLASASQSNPIVEAAVNRLRRAAPPSGNTLSHAPGPGAQAAARAIQFDEYPERDLEPRPTSALPPAARHSSSGSAATPVKPISQMPTSPETRDASQPVKFASSAPPARAQASTNQFERSSIAPRFQAAEGAPYASEDYISSSGTATLFARAAASAIDVGIIAFSYLPFLTAFTLFEADFSRWAVYALAVMTSASIFCYHLLMVGMAGRTTGMAFCKLRIVDAASERVPPTLAQAFGRAIGATLSLLLLPLNLLVILLSLERLSLSDYLSGTIIVRQ
jgi:uncharacterized RDD family membrane protein YckC